MKKIVPVIEVAIVLALFAQLRGLLRGTSFATWQVESFGSAPLTSTVLFFLLPMAFVIAGGRNPGLYGLATSDLAYHRQTGLRAAWALLPVGILFPVIGLLGSTHERWLGGLVLTAGVLTAGFFAIRTTGPFETREPRAVSPLGAGAYLAVLALGALACFALGFVSKVLVGIVQKLIFVGFLEEFFFRGYVQSRLNDAFGRPFRIAGVAFGASLVLSAAIFGLAHPLTSPVGFPWPWVLWTGAGGLVFGFLREKTGSALAPAIAHGLWVLPTVFFAP